MGVPTGTAPGTLYLDFLDYGMVVCIACYQIAAIMSKSGWTPLYAAMRAGSIRNAETGGFRLSVTKPSGEVKCYNKVVTGVANKIY